ARLSWLHNILICLSILSSCLTYPQKIEVEKLRRLTYDPRGKMVYLKIKSPPKNIRRDLFKVDAELSTEVIKDQKVCLTYSPVIWNNTSIIKLNEEILARVLIKPLNYDLKSLSSPLAYESFLLRRGYLASVELLSVEKITVEGRDSNTELYFEYLSNKFGATPELALTIATVFGHTAFLDEEIKNLFRNTGLSHIIVVSGYHLGIIFIVFYQIAAFVFKRIPFVLQFVPLELVSSFFAVGFVMLYCEIIFMDLSAERAVYALILLIYSKLICRKIDPLRAVMFVFLILILLYPCCFYEAGIELTFAALCALISAGYIFEKCLKITQFRNSAFIMWCLKIFLYSFLPWLFTMPVLLFWFGQIVPFGFLYNIIFASALSINVILVSGGLLLAEMFSLPYAGELLQISLKITAFSLDSLQIVESFLKYHGLSVIRLE
ncbi:MAG: ComEC/Rec2 family competence protein, partial [Proteobacteria bacterium]|nr:ComEC/Rec2 family competence protein [Pseudomonadota bacterium]